MISENSKEVGVCPACKGKLILTELPCPAQIEFCDLAHDGAMCLNCGQMFGLSRK